MAIFSSKKNQKLLIFTIIASISVALLLLFYCIYINQTREIMVGRYNAGIEKIQNEHFQEGIDILITLGDYKDSKEQIEFAKTSLANEKAYENAEQLFSNEEYDLAATQFEQLGDYKDSENRAKSAHDLAVKKEQRQKEEEKKEKSFENANALYQEGKFKEALELFVDLADYKNSQALAQECRMALKPLAFSNTISAGIRFSAGVTQDGKIFFSGKDFEYENELYTWNDIISVCVQGHVVMGLKKDGSVVTAGQVVNRNTSYYIDTSEWHDIVAISAGQSYVVGLKKDGTLTAQGHNGDGQANIKEWTDIVTIDTGWRTTVGLDSSGNVHITGYGSKQQLQQIAAHSDKWTDIVAISTGGGSNGGGGGHTVGLRKDGTVVAVGANDNHQLEVDGWENIIAISAGDNHTVGLKSDGTVVTTPIGSKVSNEISTWENIVDISAGYGFTLGLKADGTVVAAGNYTDGQSNVTPWNDIARREEWQLVFDDNFDFLLDI